MYYVTATCSDEYHPALKYAFRSGGVNLHLSMLFQVGGTFVKMIRYDTKLYDSDAIIAANGQVSRWQGKNVTSADNKCHIEIMLLS